MIKAEKINSMKKDQQGVILVLTLIILASLLSTAIGFSLFIISDLRQAGTIDDSVVAYYAAESGLERIVFLFRKIGYERLSDLSEAEKNGSFTDGNKARWSLDNSRDYEPVVIRQRLKNGQSIKLYFLNRSSGENQVEKIGILWARAVGAPKLQVSFTQLSPQFQRDGEVETLIYYTDQNKVELSDVNEVFYNFLDLNLDGSVGAKRDYVVEIKVLGSAGDLVDFLQIKGYFNNEHYPEAITNLTLRSNGFYGRAQQEIIAHLPPRDPVSGLLGFVLFAEEDITKDY